MATTRSGSAKKQATKKPNQKAKATTKITTIRANAVPTKTPFKRVSGEPNYPAIIVAEVIGTFVLTLVALLALQQFASLYVGLTLAVLVLAVGAVSGAHLNPAVTFGLWAARSLKTVLVPVYWIAQFVGAILAVLLLNTLSSQGYALDFSRFTNFSWSILTIELLGTAVFLFGIVTITHYKDLTTTGKAFGIGLALTVGLLVSGSALSALQTSKYNEYSNAAQNNTQNEAVEMPRELYIEGATLNPAVALAETERTESQLNGYSATADEPKYSRIGLETILGTLIGAALGANLALLVTAAQRKEQ